jgi:hypothetical protein
MLPQHGLGNDPVIHTDRELFTISVDKWTV